MNAIRSWFVRFGAVLTLLLAVQPFAATAQSGEEQGKRLRIGDHLFVANPITPDALPRTYVAQELGIGQAVDIDFLPEFVIGDDTIQGLSGDLLYALLGLEYQARIKPWLGFFGKVELLGRLGTDVGALLSQGATVLTGFELGWVVRVVETDKIGLSATANVWNNSFTGINLLDWVEGIVDDEPVDLVQNTPSVRGGGGLRFAWAASQLFGVTANTLVGFGESRARRGENSVSYTLAAGVDLDLYQRYSVPLGFALGTEFNNAPREGDEFADRANRVNFRIAYTGREDFLIALQLGWSQLSFIEDTEDDNVSTGALSLNTRYYF